MLRFASYLSKHTLPWREIESKRARHHVFATTWYNADAHPLTSLDRLDYRASGLLTLACVRRLCIDLRNVVISRYRHIQAVAPPHRLKLMILLGRQGQRERMPEARCIKRYTRNDARTLREVEADTKVGRSKHDK